MPSLRFAFAFLLAICLFAVPAAATWSIVIVDLATGEIAIGIATCLTGFDLRPNAILVIPGYGVAAAQSFIGPLSLRQLIRTEMLNGTPVSQILALLAAADPSHQSRQYGIVSLTGGEVTFTGNQAGAWAGGVTGQIGTLRYAIQGNVLTGMPVVTAAEFAIQTTVGTIGDKLMAGMEAARSFGGDGRCSCSASAPTSCGSPPPSFTKAAHVGLMIVSRPSDLDAACNGTLGCAAGNYWMDFDIANQQATDPDPVLQLQALYNTWKLQQVGRPDHFESTVAMSATNLKANGIDTITGTVTLRDAQGNLLGNTLPVTVGLRSNSTVSNIAFGPVTPQANGTYTFTMQGNLRSGEAIVDVAVNDGLGRVGIWPQPHVQVSDLFGPCGTGAIGNGQGGVIDALRVQNTGGVDRVTEVGFGQPFTITLDPPTGSASTFPIGMFALWAHVGIPAAGTEVPLGGQNGALCFTPAPFSPLAPTLLLADSFGLGGAIFAGPAPWSLPLPGVAAVLDVALQGVMVVDTQATFAATNAVYLRLEALPPPVITAIVPQAPTPGQLATVQGSNFFGGMQGTVAGASVPVTIVSATQATFSMPAGVPCDSQLVLTNQGGLTAHKLINGTPVVVSSPVSGTAAGGTTIVFTGQNLQGVGITFNGAPMTISTNLPTVILGILPPGTPGPATIVLTNPNGCATSVPFTYL